MRLKKIDPETYFSIRDAWINEAFMREDSQKSLDALEYNLLEDPETYWYEGPDEKTFFYLSDLVPGQWGRVNIVNANNWDVFEDRKISLAVLKLMADEHNLHKLEAIAPAPVNRLKSLYRHLGFQIEGRLRQRMMYDGGWVDVETYGILAEEIDGKIKKRQRRRRSRRADVQIDPDPKKGEKEKA